MTIKYSTAAVAVALEISEKDITKKVPGSAAGLSLAQILALVEDESINRVSDEAAVVRKIVQGIARLEDSAAGSSASATAAK